MSTLGVANVSFFDCAKIVISKLPIVNNLITLEGVKDTHIKIVTNIRLPRIVLASLIGMGLSVVGVAFQGMFKNPMADPYVLGVSSGAALGAASAIVLGYNAKFMGLGIIAIMAFVGAIITTVCVYNIARVGNKVHTNTLLLTGIAISLFLSSVISVLMIFNRNQIEKIIFWTMGSISAASWEQVLTLIPFIGFGTLFILFFSRELNIILLGDESAKNLGVEIERVKKIILVIASFMVAACVSVSGIIGFVGLIIPHMVRILVGPDHRVLIPFSALGGAIFVILSDTFARTIVAPIEIPLGVVTAILGAPYFIYLIYKSKKKVFR